MHHFVPAAQRLKQK